MFLSDHILVQLRLDLRGFRNSQLAGNKPLLRLLGDDLVAEFDTFVTDVDGRAGDQFSYLVLTLPAEGTMQGGTVIPSVWLHLRLLSDLTLRFDRTVNDPFIHDPIISGLENRHV